MWAAEGLEGREHGLYIANSYSSFDTQLDDPTFENASLNHPVHILDRDNNNDVNGDANRS